MDLHFRVADADGAVADDAVADRPPCRPRRRLPCPAAAPRSDRWPPSSCGQAARRTRQQHDAGRSGGDDQRSARPARRRTPGSSQCRRRRQPAGPGQFGSEVPGTHRRGPCLPAESRRGPPAPARASKRATRWPTGPVPPRTRAGDVLQFEMPAGGANGRGRGGVGAVGVQHDRHASGRTAAIMCLRASCSSFSPAATSLPPMKMAVLFRSFGAAREDRPVHQALHVAPA